MGTTTLKCRMVVHVRLLIFGIFSHLYDLILHCTFINFGHKWTVNQNFFKNESFFYRLIVEWQIMVKLGCIHYIAVLILWLALYIPIRWIENQLFLKKSGKRKKDVSWDMPIGLNSEPLIDDSHLYVYSGLYVYCFREKFPPVRLFPPVLLFRTLEYSSF